FNETVTPKDYYGNVLTDYTGTVSLTSTDPLVPYLGSHVFVAADQGTFTFTGLVLETAQSAAVTAGDSAVSTVTYVTVNPGDFAQLLLEPTSTVVRSGVPLYTYLIAADAFGNAVPGYRGSVTVTSSDPQRPVQYTHTFTAADRGIVVFFVYLYTVGDQTLTADDGVVSQTIDITVLSGTGPGSAGGGGGGTSA